MCRSSCDAGYVEYPDVRYANQAAPFFIIATAVACVGWRCLDYGTGCGAHASRKTSWLWGGGGACLQEGP